jgi:hypothetical protein
LQGDLELRSGAFTSVLEKWKSAMKIFRDQNDATGLAEVLGRCYQILSGNPDRIESLLVKEIIREAGSPAFRLRVPNRFFLFLQTATWLLPLTGAVFMTVVISTYLNTHERGEYRLLAAWLLSANGLLVSGTVLLGLMIMALFWACWVCWPYAGHASRLDWFMAAVNYQALWD